MFFIVATGGKHEFVPKDVFMEAEKYAKVRAEYLIIYIINTLHQDV